MVKLPDLPALVIHAEGLCFTSVCTTLTDKAEIEVEVNRRTPTGISRPWTIHPGPFRCGKSNPCPCDEHAGRTHYLLSC